MARIRTIKPEFFTSEDIVSLTPLARLLYIALWCEADREGRLQWKPRTFKLRYFPAEDTPIEDTAKELIQRGLVVLYGDGLAQIPTFLEHQHVNPREAQSSLPAPSPVDNSREIHASARVSDAQVGREGKEGKEGNDASARVEAETTGDKSPKVKGTTAAFGPRWWESPEATLARAQELGLSTRGQDWVQLKQTVRDAEAKKKAA